MTTSPFAISNPFAVPGPFVAVCVALALAAHAAHAQAPGTQAPGPQSPGMLAPGMLAPGTQAPGPHASAMHSSGMQTGSPSTDTPSNQGYKAAMKAMEKGMDTPYSGDPDRDFVAGMLPHHQGAVAMAQVELKYGRDPELRHLATQIVAAQRREIALMKRWQTAHPAQ